MQRNDFWKMAAKGGLLPTTFDVQMWKEAWAHGLNSLAQRLTQFQRTPSWKTYDDVGVGISRLNTLSQTLLIVPTYLGGVKDEVRKSLYGQSMAEQQSLITTHKTTVQTFLGKRAFQGDRAEQMRARREFQYWTGFSPKRAECVQIENRLEREGRPLHFTHLQNMNSMPSMKRKFRNKALELGLTGYAIDNTDYDAAVAVCLQDNEDTRKSLWTGMQEGPIETHEVQQLLEARKAWAGDAQLPSYLSYQDRLNDGLTFQAAEKEFLKSIKTCVETERTYRQHHIDLALTQSKWKPENEQDAYMPWNAMYLEWNAAETHDDLEGREFPLKRVIQVIVPHIMQMGGWETIGAPIRVGRGKQCLYQYRLHKEGKMATMYLAPNPGENVKDSDAYQAFACMLRERWTGNQKGTSPIVFVGQNFDLSQGCLTSLSQLGYLCHELGHVLHFLSLKGETFDEYTRMSPNLTELPSLMFERLILDPALLQKWCNPKFKAGRKQAHWKKMVKSPRNITTHLQNLERTCFDSMVHRTHDANLVQLHQKMRKQVGMDELHPLDQSAMTLFDRTENAGVYATYLIGDSMSEHLVRGVVTAEKVADELNYLLTHVLSHNHQTGALWKKAYGISLFETFVKGKARLDKIHLQDAKACIRRMKIKINKAKR